MELDDRVVRAANLGDQQARKQVTRWLTRELRRRLRKYCRDFDQLDELLQMTMITVWSEAERKAPNDAQGLLRWAVGVGRMKAKASSRLAARKRDREAKLEFMATPERGPSPSSSLAHAEMLDAMDNYIAQLATPHRETVSDWRSGASVKELAAARGVAEETIRWRRRKAVEELEKIREREGLTPAPHDS